MSRLSEREGLQVIDEAREESGFIQGVVDVFGSRLINAVNDAFEIALNDVKWCAKFVGNIGCEIAALLFVAFQLVDHVIETLCKFSKLTGIMFRDSDG